MSAPDRQAAQTFAQTCRRCGQSKAAEEFGFRNEALEQRHRRCKVCVAAYGREHYASNRQAYITRNVATMRERRRGLKERVWRYLADQGASTAASGIRSSWSLTTSNVRRSAWRFTGWRSQPSRGQRSRPRSRSAKSECANCHRLRTAAQFGWAVPTEPHAELHAGRPRARLERPLCTTARVARPTLVSHGHLFCGGCGRAKPLHEFYASNHSMCAECFRAYQARALRAGGEPSRTSSATHASCGIVSWLAGVLEFDHREPETKVESVTVLAHRGGKWANVEAEIANATFAARTATGDAPRLSSTGGSASSPSPNSGPGGLEPAT